MNIIIIVLKRSPLDGGSGGGGGCSEQLLFEYTPARLVTVHVSFCKLNTWNKYPYSPIDYDLFHSKLKCNLTDVHV